MQMHVSIFFLHIMISINLGNSFKVIKMRPDYTSQITEGKNKKTNHQIKKIRAPGPLM